MFRWMQTTQATPFTLSKEGHTIMFELLFTQGGTAGLSHAVLLCCDVHAEGILKYYAFPSMGVGHWEQGQQQNTAVKKFEAGEVAAERDMAAVPDGDLILEGGSHIQAVVVVLAWLRSLRDQAR